MRKRIFYAIIGITIFSLLIFSMLNTIIIYNQVFETEKKELKSEFYQIQSFLTSRNQEIDLEQFVSTSRITLISSSGEVLYDSRKDYLTMDNHANRPEVKLLETNDFAENTRHSNTVGLQTYYYAEKINDNEILRLSITMETIWTVIARILPYMLLFIFFILLAATFVSKKLATNIVAPLKNIDEPVYDELDPFYNKIKVQRKFIQKQKNQAESFRREFSANVSHELKTPLTSILGYSELIHTGLAKAEDTKTFCGKIHDEAKYLLELIDDIIKISRLDESQYPLEADFFELDEMILALIERISPIAKSSNIKIQHQLTPMTIRGVKSLLNEAIYNILDNAIKYNLQNGKIEIILKKLENEVQLEIIDNGIGIAAADLERIFERFYRADKSHSSSVRGTGLGLSIVKHAINLHQGRVEVKSELHKGTTFRIFLPFNS